MAGITSSFQRRVSAAHTAHLFFASRIAERISRSAQKLVAINDEDLFRWKSVREGPGFIRNSAWFHPPFFQLFTQNYDSLVEVPMVRYLKGLLQN